MRKKRKKRVLTCKSPSSAIPSRIGRDCRMVAMCRVCRHIAGGRLRRFNIHSHIHGYPRAAKASPSKPSCYLRNYILYEYIRQWDFFLCENEIAEITKNRKRETKKASRKVKEVKKKHLMNKINVSPSPRDQNHHFFFFLNHHFFNLKLSS